MVLVVRGEVEQSALILFWVKFYKLFVVVCFCFETEATLKDGTLVPVKGGKVLLADGVMSSTCDSTSQAVHPNPKFKYLVQLQHEQ